MSSLILPGQRDAAPKHATYLQWDIWRLSGWSASVIALG